MTLEAEEVIDLDDSTNCNTKKNCLNDSTGHNKLCVSKNENIRRRSLRSGKITDNKKASHKETLFSRPQTPTELINGMTSFTFSNYFTPLSKDNSPLPTLSWADSNEVWEIMLQKDREYKRDSLYIRKHPSLQPRMRSVLLDWLIEVIVHFCSDLFITNGFS